MQVEMFWLPDLVCLASSSYLNNQIPNIIFWYIFGLLLNVIVVEIGINCILIIRMCEIDNEFVWSCFLVLNMWCDMCSYIFFSWLFDKCEDRITKYSSLLLSSRSSSARLDWPDLNMCTFLSHLIIFVLKTSVWFV